MSRAPYVDSIRANAEVDAQVNFAKHRVVAEGEGRWYFGAPGTGHFSFRVITAPRMVMMYGDAGELVLIPSDTDALRWLRSVLSSGPGKYSVQYIAEKVPADLRITEFQQELVKAYLDDLTAELNEGSASERRAEEIASFLDYYGDDKFETAEEFYEALSSSRLNDEYPDVCGLTWHFFHRVAGLEAFCRALTQLEVDSAPPTGP